jgi:hypothetical protein
MENGDNIVTTRFFFWQKNIPGAVKKIFQLDFSTPRDAEWHPLIPRIAQWRQSRGFFPPDRLIGRCDVGETDSFWWIIFDIVFAPNSLQ